TGAAVEFVTRPEYVESFVRQMRSRGGIPKWFQLVIHARFKARTPIAIRPVTVHALNSAESPHAASARNGFGFIGWALKRPIDLGNDRQVGPRFGLWDPLAVWRV